MITYSVDDVQYVAVVVGISNLHVGGLEGPYAKAIADKPELRAKARSAGAGIWVFSL